MHKQIGMEQVITAPDEEWITYLAKMWLLGNEISTNILGEEMDGSLDDLERLQRIIDSNEIPVEKTQLLQSLGIVFGKVFVNQTPDFDWWVLEDEYGKDACVRYKETTLLVFPQTMISKRIEDREEIEVGELFKDLEEKIESIKLESYPNA